MLLVAAFVAGFLYIRRRWAETPSIVPLEDVFGAPFNKHIELEVTIDDKQAGSLRFELLDQVATETAQAFSQRCAGGAHDGNEFYRIVPGFVMQGGDDSEDREDAVKPFKRGRLGTTSGLLVMVRAGPPDDVAVFYHPKERRCSTGATSTSGRWPMVSTCLKESRPRATPRALP